MHRRSLTFRFIVPLAFTIAATTSEACLFAQGLEYVKANYTKQEHRIPMRDGVQLFTSVYLPKDKSKTYPIMLTRTPYSVSPYGVEEYRTDLGPSRLFGKDGYIVVYQDVRGCWMSEGEFVNMRPYQPQKSSPKETDESSDTFDTIEWLLKNVPGHNGRVGMWGISYPGFYTAAGMIDAHPALKAASPQAPVTDWFASDDWHHNGAFMLPHAFNFFASFGHPRQQPTSQRHERVDFGDPDGYHFFLTMGPLSNVNAKYFKDDVPFWRELMQHGTYDAFWKARNLRPHLKNIKPAVMTVGGWFDAENLFGALETYKNVEAHSPGATNILVMGPWRHGGWGGGDGASLGGVPFFSKTAEYYREQIEFPFFQYYLKDRGSPNFPEAWVFETGTNEWKKYDQWPPRNLRRRSLYFEDQGRLSFEPPADTGESAFDEYVSDPAHPVEYIDQIEFRMTGDYMIQDQRVASRRPDVLVYQGPMLTEDLTISGGIEARLYVSTTGTDSDWVVKLIDVYPNDFQGTDGHPADAKLRGYQQLVRGDVMRGKFRNGLDKPEPFVPRSPTTVGFRLPDVEHTFRKGHRIMVQVQSTWFPLIDRNPQTFVDIYNAKESDFQKATQRVYRSSTRASHLEISERTR